LNLEDPLTDQTNTAINYHHHTNDYGIDKRIELRSNVKVSDWNTNDYQVYTTEQNISGASNYFLQITGELNEEYFTNNDIVDVAALRQAQAGESPILFEVDEINNKILFDSPLYSPQQSFVAPYLEIPSSIISLITFTNSNPSIKIHVLKLSPSFL